MSDSYSDIIDTQWPRHSFRERMSLAKRAKIFLPFSALKGHNEAIAETLNENELAIAKSDKGSLFDDCSPEYFD